MSEHETGVLVSGAGVAGTVLAFWLRRHGFTPTVVEQAPAMRTAGGHPVDLWGSAVDVVERMGLLAEVEAARTRNDASSMIRPGRSPIEVDVTALAGSISDRGVELPRDELTSLLYGASRREVEYLFGDSVAALEEDERGVQVTFRHAPPRRFDLVVGADGLHSTVRRLAFGPESRFRRHLGAYLAVATIPNVFALEGRLLTYPTVDALTVVYPVRSTGDARAVFMFRTPAELAYDRHDIEGQKRLVREAFADRGWELPRLLDHVDDADAFYFDSISQVRMDTVTRGRVALVGDAGYAPGAGVGGGTSLAVVGGFVLARELAAADGDHAVGFRRYEDAMREAVLGSRDVGPALLSSLLPRSRGAIRRGQQFARVLPKLPRPLTRRLPLLPRRALDGLRAITSVPLAGAAPSEPDRSEQCA